ncbi:MAG: TolC family protein [Proteobacteria bacterium]|nr:TolC family protein [Pseudomonadota bacterium]MDA0844479.1 TolC family protein [Pseudomonadota bacterium]
MLGLAAICLVSGVAPHGPAGADTGLLALAPEVTRALLQHPEVAEANARVCQSVHRLGLSKAESRPQLGLEISGGRQIVERVKGEGGRPDNRRPSESGRDPEEEDFLNPTGALSDDQVSGAHKRDYAHRSRDNIYDGTLSVRYRLVDWGQNSAAIETQNLLYQVAQIEAQTTLAERSFQLLRLAMRLARTDQMLAEQQKAADLIVRETASIEARVRAGAGRLAELREAKLLVLDADIDINRTRANRDQLVEQIKLDYDLGADDAAHIFAVYMQHRPEPLKFLEPAERDGVLMGIVQRVATNTTQPENQMPYYETIIEIPEVRLTKSGIQPEITPGMPLTVDILGDKRTVMNYIITPIEKSWKSAFREQ